MQISMPFGLLSTHRVNAIWTQSVQALSPFNSCLTAHYSGIFHPFYRPRQAYLQGLTHPLDLLSGQYSVRQHIESYTLCNVNLNWDYVNLSVCANLYIETTQSRCGQSKVTQVSVLNYLLIADTRVEYTIASLFERSMLIRTDTFSTKNNARNISCSNSFWGILSMLNVILTYFVA